MTAAEFVAKWSRAALSERSSSQQHFLDLCELVGHPKPAEIDPTGDSFCFERGTEKHGGGDGWADVWKRGFFAFEYKGRHANLAKAFDQLLRYRASLENPPLLVVCDTDTIEIRTNFTGTPEAVYRFTTLEIGQPRNLEILHALFHDPVRLRPGRSSEAITREAAAALASLAGSLRTRGQDAEASARFLDRIVFCLFAEDVGLLPDGIFGNILENTLTDPERFARYASELFRAMADGGEFQFKPIAHFNGGLFSDPVVPPFEFSEIAAIHVAAQLDWGAVDPSIFGTLFQRGLDPSTRAALGAEYTGRADIEDLVEPVLIAPLRREWEAIQYTIRNLLATGKKNPKSGVTHKAPTGAALRKALAEASSIKHAFLHRLARIHVLDPACGSGNFLYIALQKLKDLEKEVILFGGSEGVETSFFPTVGPWQFHGIEINPTPTNSPNSPSGSATSNGIAAMATRSKIPPSSKNSTTFTSWMPCSISAIPQIPRKRNGRFFGLIEKWSSSGILRFWVIRSCVGNLVINMSNHCGGSLRDEFPGSRISVAIGSRKPAHISKKECLIALDSWPRKESAVAQTVRF